MQRPEANWRARPPTGRASLLVSGWPELSPAQAEVRTTGVIQHVFHHRLPQQKPRLSADRQYRPCAGFGSDRLATAICGAWFHGWRSGSTVRPLRLPGPLLVLRRRTQHYAPANVLEALEPIPRPLPYSIEDLPSGWVCQRQRPLIISNLSRETRGRFRGTSGPVLSAESAAYLRRPPLGAGSRARLRVQATGCPTMNRVGVPCLFANQVRGAVAKSPGLQKSRHSGTSFTRKRAYLEEESARSQLRPDRSGKCTARQF